MSDTKVTDESRQVQLNGGDYNPSGRAAAAASAAKSAGAGSSVVSLDGSRGSSDKGSQASSKVEPSKPDSKRVDGVKNPAGDAKKPVGNTGQTGTDQLGNTTSINDRKV